MPSLKYLLLSFAVAGHVFAQNGCQAPEIVIQNQGDVRPISNCQTVTGNIVIAETTTGTIDLSGIQRIQGSLICQNARELTGISSRDLTIIGEQFNLYGLTILSALDLPALSRVGSLNWTALPALQELSFNSQVRQAEDVFISNTNLKSLDGINLETVRKFDVNNNQYLAKIDTQLGNISEALNIQANSPDLAVSFPNLVWAFNMTFWNCSSVRLPSLLTVNQSMGFRGNQFESFTAPNLTRTGERGSLVFVGNGRLSNITFPQLETIGGDLLVANNTELKAIDGFPKLATVGGAIVWVGDFTNASLPVLDDVRGSLRINTTGQFDCSPFRRAKNERVVKGTFSCEAAPGSTSSNSDSSSTTGGSSNPSKTNAAGQLQVDVVSILGSVVLAAGLLRMAL
jgi:hypothetical protein